MTVRSASEVEALLGVIRGVRRELGVLGVGVGAGAGTDTDTGEARPEGDGEARPEGDGEARPEGGPGARPEGDGETRPETRPEGDGETRPETRPEGDDTRREAAEAAEAVLGLVEVAAEELRVVEDALRTEHEALLSARRSQRRWRDTMWDTLPVPVLLTDLAGTVIGANGNAAALLGTQVETLPRTPLTRYLPVDDRRAVRDALSDLRRGVPTSRAMVRWGPSGRPGRAVTLLAMPDGPPDGEGALLVRWVAFPVGPELAAGAEWLVATATLLDAAMIGTDRDQLLHQAVVQVTQLVPGADGATVILGSPDRVTNFAASSNQVQTGDGAQAISGEGPTSESYRTGLRCHGPDLQAEPRWPRLARLSDRGGAREVLAEPIVDPDGTVVGVLTLYAGAAHTFVPAAIEIAGWMATMLAALLRTTGERDRLLALAGQLEQALITRGVVEQAKGVLTVVCDVDADGALAILTGISNRENLRLVDVAQRVLENRGLTGRLRAPPSG